LRRSNGWFSRCKEYAETAGWTGETSTGGKACRIAANANIESNCCFEADESVAALSRASGRWTIWFEKQS